MALLVVLTTRMPAREAVDMRVGPSIFAAYFRRVVRIVGGSVFVSVYRKNTREGRHPKTLVGSPIILSQTIQLALKHAALTAEILVCHAAPHPGLNVDGAGWVRVLDKRFLFSVLLGLFLALNFYMLFFYYLSPEFEWRSLGYQLKGYAENALLFFTIGFIVATFFSIAIGWPLYLLAKYFCVSNYATSGLAGVAVSTTPYAICVFLGWNIPSLTEEAGLIVFLVIAACGGISGVVFHFLEKEAL